MPSDRRREARRRGWFAAYAISGALISVATWTVLRPHLVITDGVPEATDPLTPLGVALVNLLLLAVVWALVGAVHALSRHGRAGASRPSRPPSPAPPGAD